MESAKIDAKKILSESSQKLNEDMQTKKNKRSNKKPRRK